MSPWNSTSDDYDKGKRKREEFFSNAYLSLLQEYLEYFLPSRGPGATPHRSVRTDENRPPKRKSITEMSAEILRKNVPVGIGGRESTPPEKRTRSKPSIFQESLMDPMQRRVTSEFAIQLFAELWLCQYDLADFRNVERRRTDYQKTTDMQLWCINELVKHIVSLDLAEFSGSRVGQTQRRSGPAEEEWLAKRDAYTVIRTNLYSFLKLAFQHWPRDDSFNQVVEIWICFIRPWQGLGEGEFSEKWIHFVQDNFAFYSSLFLLFMDRAKDYNLFNAIRHHSRSGRTPHPGSNNRDGLRAIQNVMEAFSDADLLQTLRIMELAMFSLESKSGRPGGPGQFIASGLKNTPGNISDEARKFLVNSGHETRSKIDLLEGTRIQPIPAFLRDIKVRVDGSDGPMNATEMAKALQKEVDHTVERLNNIIDPKPLTRPGRRGSGPRTPGPRTPGAQIAGTPGYEEPPTPFTPGSPTSAMHAQPAPTPTSQSWNFPKYPSAGAASNVGLWLLNCIWVLFSCSMIWVFSGLRSAVSSVTASEAAGPKQPSPRQQQQMKQDIDRLKKVGGMISEIWELNADQTSMEQNAPVAMPGAIPEVNPWDEDWENQDIVPGVLAAHEVVAGGKRAGRLSDRGREQLKRGVAMSSKDDVPFKDGRRSHVIIMTYESPTLVKWTLHLGDWLDEKVALVNVRKCDLLDLIQDHFSGPRSDKNTPWSHRFGPFAGSGISPHGTTCCSTLWRG
ncbi:sphingomyelin phosphodiesterase 4, neutral membrane (neutral sphingomyelinase-3) [Rhizophlyctis rosea]|nr:sphingomyelin phosphodiesterase 4, neutral membrane (neutral sphingomyelinase-3) [Rhizophlyctis rosea]